MSDSFFRAFTPSMQFLDENGNPLVGGFLCSYKSGTSTPIATYNDNGQQNPVEILLNELGSPENGVQLDPTIEYKFVLLRADRTVVWTKDHVVAGGIGDVSLEGDDAIQVEKIVVGNAVQFVAVIRSHSIGRDLLKNPHPLVPDSRFLQYKDFNGDVVITLCDALQAWLTSQGYTP
jgi:hypothetical protein